MAIRHLPACQPETRCWYDDLIMLLTTKSCRLFAQRLRPTAFRKEKLVRFFLVRDVTSEAHVLKKLCREPVELVPCALMKLSFLHGDSQLRSSGSAKSARSKDDKGAIVSPSELREARSEVYFTPKHQNQPLPRDLPQDGA